MKRGDRLPKVNVSRFDLGNYLREVYLNIGR